MQVGIMYTNKNKFINLANKWLYLFKYNSGLQLEADNFNNLEYE